ncbi:hypothetical protein NEISICOT_01554 [Neisseria sicca ATCC 29256]|uniref:Uncharacterized protein n=1 Tax=Neisseria sicca ATCC 29256 TaxID=547045 RepID=C6M4V5_NEISI|nr:hypothetical protein NEISICOT_01554 [Neisseria sicca ATCC 29256]
MLTPNPNNGRHPAFTPNPKNGNPPVPVSDDLAAVFPQNRPTSGASDETPSRLTGLVKIMDTF